MGDKQGYPGGTSGGGQGSLDLGDALPPEVIAAGKRLFRRPALVPSASPAPVATPQEHPRRLPLGPVTKTPGTEQVYTTVAERALTRFQREKKQEWCLSLPAFVDWLSSWRDQLSPAAWRYNRAALSFHLDRLGLPDLAIEVRQMQAAPALPSTVRAPRTSAGKAKRFSFTSAVETAKALASSSHATETHELLGFWVLAGILVGLRPVEWQSANLVRAGSLLSLEVTNAKATNGRGNGGSRCIVVNDLRSNELVILDNFITRLRKAVARDGWASVYDRCRKLLYREMRRGVLSNQWIPTLYSLRHQFVADAKDAQVAPVAIAALLGHESLWTQRGYGGRRRKGKGGFRVRPSFEDLARLAGPDAARDLLGPVPG